ncbi:MAG: carboxypeptidase [Chloroflexi bacterium]|nr:carboxypeptidase [Chloroflexota bacterium]
MPLTVDFTHYYDYAELTTFLDEAQKQFPDLCRKISIGKSFEGRDIWLMEMTNTKTGDYADKPAYYVDANIHAGEVTGAMTCVYVIWYALTQYGKDETVTRLLDTRTLYVLPRISVDGSEKYLKSPYSMRSSTRYYPFDAPQPGLHTEDVDGDGNVLWMRMKDPAGSWKVSGLDPRIMIKRAPDEDGGEYYRLLREGRLTDYNGRDIKIAPSRWGLDWNRNSPFDWHPEGKQEGAGPTPLSEPETRAVHDFVVGHRNICGAQSFHTFSGVILRPYSARPDDDFPPADLEIYKKLGERGTEITGYKCISIYHDFRYETKQFIRGGFMDWLYEHLGIFVFSTELWDVTKQAGIPDADPIKFIMYERKPEDEKKLLDFADKELGGEGFAAWRPFNHPQLGPVELGGWNFKYFWQNPPGKYLQEIAHKNAHFVYSHALMSPLLTLDDLTAEPLGADVYRVGCFARNAGFLSTAVTAKALDQKAVRPIRAEITPGEGVTLVSGERRQELGQLEGRSNKLRMDLFHPGEGTDHQKWVEWVVREPKGAIVEVAIISERAGSVRRYVRL